MKAIVDTYKCDEETKYTYQLPFFKSFWEDQENYEEEIELEPECLESSEEEEEEEECQITTTVKIPNGKEKKHDRALKHPKKVIPLQKKTESVNTKKTNAKNVESLAPSPQPKTTRSGRAVKNKKMFNDYVVFDETDDDAFVESSKKVQRKKTAVKQVQSTRFSAGTRATDSTH